VTTQELATSLDVPVVRVMKALMDLGILATAKTEVSDEDAEFVRKLIRMDDER